MISNGNHGHWRNRINFVLPPDDKPMETTDTTPVAKQRQLRRVHYVIGYHQTGIPYRWPHHEEYARKTDAKKAMDALGQRALSVLRIETYLVK